MSSFPTVPLFLVQQLFPVSRILVLYLSNFLNLLLLLLLLLPISCMECCSLLLNRSLLTLEVRNLCFLIWFIIHFSFWGWASRVLHRPLARKLCNIEIKIG
jgi:hypothetical protein